MLALKQDSDKKLSPVIGHIESLLTVKCDAVHDWFANKWLVKAPYVYTSVDLRHSGHKLVPVDTNLYPAGFNNLSPAARSRAVEEFRRYFASLARPPQRALIIPENHTRNLNYLENLATLSGLVQQAGVEVRIGNLQAERGSPLHLQSASGLPVTQSPLERVGKLLGTDDGFVPDIIILNNDFTSGESPLLDGITQPILPSMRLGWYRRRKSEHFTQYEKLVKEFGELFGIDPWLISAQFHRCGIVNFDEKKGIECVALGVERVLHITRTKYAEHGITEEPYVYVKADSGTYGMGIMTVRSGEELFELNKKTRNKMKTIKEGASNTEVIVQEGVPTIDRVGEAFAEPMMYLVGGVTVGGAYRVNAGRDAENNLNAAGMEFAGMCDETEADCGRVSVCKGSFGALGLIASLAALAATRETYSHWDYSI